MKGQRFHFCPLCGGRLIYSNQFERERLRCADCGEIMYENPIVGVAGILLDDESRILLGRRRKGVYAGYWCIPCGYLEYDEELRQGLVREFKEETGLEVAVQELFAAHSNFHDPLCHTVGVWFIISRSRGELKAGDDLDEVGFYELDKVPPLAFPTDFTVIEALRQKMGK